ncbi:MAG: SOS response-associated peptidase [Bacteroidota bacterium]
MCGRFSFAIEDALINERFGVSVRSAVYKARYNCAPSQELAIISSGSPETLSFFKWGLVPLWAKDRTIGNKMINARAETITEKASFRQAFKGRRCIVPADGFFEWKRSSLKIPYRFSLLDSSLFAMAGIWETWKDHSGNDLHTFAIITTSANALVARIHDRMPVILNRADEQKWIGETSTNELISLLRPFDHELMKAHRVSQKVNSPFNDSPDLVEEMESL